ncbi:MAG: ATP:cob(I)alamin adenosyltransferase [Beggiatoa sp. IS2]|nr:MAG: ATP:cob(I)alamin adenosyltransferase [Beggiatoa sp. IS2]
MRHRLSKIYTRTGDQGTTRLGDGTLVEKDALRVETYGTIDELNSLIGLMLAYPLPTEVRLCLIDVQHDLFDLGGELSIPTQHILTTVYVTRLEEMCDKFNQNLPPLEEFILPGGTLVAATCHLARTVCRRTERCVVTLMRTETVNPHSLAYLNRLSDLLFIIARILVQSSDSEEVLWRSKK